jgi:hypothetical protein
MTTHLLLFIFCILSIEIFLYGKALSSIYCVYSKINKLIKIIPSRKISDHWKEKVIIQYALIMMKNSLKILFILLLITLILIFFVFINYKFLENLSSFLGIIESLVICFFYISLRKKFL